MAKTIVHIAPLNHLLWMMIVAMVSYYVDYGRIHLVLNKTLTDDTSVKQAQIKTFFVQSNFVETW